MNKVGTNWGFVVIISLILAIIIIILFTPLYGKILTLKDAIFGLGP